MNSDVLLIFIWASVNSISPYTVKLVWFVRRVIFGWLNVDVLIFVLNAIPFFMIGGRFSFRYSVMAWIISSGPLLWVSVSGSVSHQRYLAVSAKIFV